MQAHTDTRGALKPNTNATAIARPTIAVSVTLSRHRKKLAAILLVGGALALVRPFSAVGNGLQTPPLGDVSLKAPYSVAIGAHDSVYVDDGNQIVHLSAAGRLLDRLGATDANVATDRQGNLYVARNGRIEKVSPSGAILRQWSAGNAPVQLLAVDQHDNVFVAEEIVTSENTSLVKRFSATGRLLSQWLTVTPAGMAVGAGGFVYIVTSATGDDKMMRLAPTTGKVLARWSAITSGGTSYDAVGADTGGTIYVGATVDGDTPFVIQKLVHAGHHDTFQTLNAADELVAGLAVDRHGAIYVIRNSYARPCPSNLGLDKLSPSGDVVGTFRSCPAQN